MALSRQVAVLLILSICLAFACIPTVSPDDDDEYEEDFVTTLAAIVAEDFTDTSPATSSPTTASTTTPATTTTTEATTTSTTSTSTTTTTTSTTTTTTTGMCPSASWELNPVNNQCYLLLQNPGPVTNPDTTCMTVYPGSHTASIADADENTFVLNYLTSIPTQYAFIGGTSTDPGVATSWSWTDGSTYSYTNWDTADLNPVSSTMFYCMIMYADGTARNGEWGNDPCNGPYNILCKIAAS